MGLWGSGCAGTPLCCATSHMSPVLGTELAPAASHRGAATRKEAPPNSQDALEKFLLALCADLLITAANFFPSSG